MDPGKRTFYLGRYNCIEQLGSGPLGETYRAKIYGVAGFEKQFAVKRLHPELSGDEAFVARFVQAASAFSALEHPAIARVHEVNAQGAHYYIVIDLVRGLDVRRLLDSLQQRGEALAPDAAMAIVVQVADALEYAHSRTNTLPGGVLHLGLTAPSIMVTYDGEVKLVDVGLLASIVRPGWSDDDALTPTLAYLAPEELRADPLDARADVFSLGVVLFELLGGSRAFLSDRASELRRAIENGPPPPPPADPRLQEIVTRALQPDRERRYANVGEMRAAVQGILSGRFDRARADLSALVRRLVMPRERRTGAFAAVTLPPPTPSVTPVSAAKPPPIPTTAHAWAPPMPKPPAGGKLSPIPVQNTLAGIGPDDQALVPIELVELPGSPTEKAMSSVATDDAETTRVPRSDEVETNRIRRAQLPEVSAPTSPANGAAAAPAMAEPTGASAGAAQAPANDTTVAKPVEEAAPATAVGAAEPSWLPPTPASPPPSPMPTFAEPTVEKPGPVERTKPSVPGVKLPPADRGSRAVLGTVVLLAAAGALAIYAGLSGSPQATPQTATPQPVATAPGADVARLAAAPSLAAAPQHAPTATNPPAAASAPAVPNPSAAATPTTAAKSPTGAKPATSANPATAADAPTVPNTPTAANAPAAANVPTGLGTTGFAVTTTPPGAAVFVDGEEKGTTPATLDVAPGKHKLVLAAEGQKLVQREVNVTPAGHFDVTLEPAKLSSGIAGPAGLKVRCRTHGEIRIFVDGEDSGRNCPNEERISVTPGPHKIGLLSARTGEMHEVEHEVVEGNNSTRVYVKY